MLRIEEHECSRDKTKTKTETQGTLEGGNQVEEEESAKKTRRSNSVLCCPRNQVERMFLGGKFAQLCQMLPLSQVG